MDHIIIAPHPDDEIIGCFDILNNKENRVIVLYTEQISNDRKKEAMTLKDYFESVKAQMFSGDIPQPFLNPNNILYFPDHTYEIHPAHRYWGAYGEKLLRRNKLNVVFYSVNMNAPYIFEQREFVGKEYVLDQVYSSQKDLWKNDKKFTLFEGRVKWMI